jgi:hypothetical protein
MTVPRERAEAIADHIENLINRSLVRMHDSNYGGTDYISNVKQALIDALMALDDSWQEGYDEGYEDGLGAADDNKDNEGYGRERER